MTMNRDSWLQTCEQDEGRQQKDNTHVFVPILFMRRKIKDMKMRLFRKVIIYLLKPNTRFYNRDGMCPSSHNLQQLINIITYNQFIHNCTDIFNIHFPIFYRSKF